MERVINDSWSRDCLSHMPQFQEILARSTDIKLNLYTCTLRNLNVLGHSSYPWSHEEDSVYHGVVIHTGTLPGGTISPINEGDNLVHEVSDFCKLKTCHTVTTHDSNKNHFLTSKVSKVVEPYLQKQLRKTCESSRRCWGEHFLFLGFTW